MPVLEVLPGLHVDAVTAERWGFLNCALPADDLTTHVDEMARRIATFPPNAVRIAKESVRSAAERPLVDGLRYETILFQTLLRDPDAGPAMQAFLDSGGQTVDGESRVGDVMGEIHRR